jgi:N4-gp56 family major capsid protein
MGYNTGKTGGVSTIDKKANNVQLTQAHYDKMAIIDIKDEMILSQMSGTMAMPMHQGKEVVKHRYIAVLDDLNEVAASGIDAFGVASNGNLYGSSRGMGFINGKMPDLGETTARANKVSFSRKEVRGSIKNRGIFYEWTKDEMNFDSDPKLKQHITREAARAANQINEDVLAMELINGAGVVYYAGTGVTSVATVNQTAVPTIQDLIRMDTELDNNKCPRDTTVISGSNMSDTRTVQAARYMFISADMKMDFMSIKALNGTDDAFVPLEQYAKANSNGKYITAIHGEIGKVGPFRIVVHPKMVKYSTAADAAAGAAWVTGAGRDAFRNDGTKFEVYANLVIGSGSFTHIGFEFGSGTQGKFNVIHKTPEDLRTRENPYAKFGMSVLEWWNGVLIERPEWICNYVTASRY